MNRREVRMMVNGDDVSVTIAPNRSLADVLRDDLELTGTHVGCEHGVCGACTVVVDGVAVRSCLMLGVQASGKVVTTIEGLARNGDELHPLQEAFRDSHSFQCGFCTPGFVMAALALLLERQDFDDAELREELSGNICRCTGYQSIIAGVRLAAERGVGA